MAPVLSCSGCRIVCSATGIGDELGVAPRPRVEAGFSPAGSRQAVKG